MPNKLTDAEVKKALEWHLNGENHCDGCPLFVLKNTTTYCVDVLMQNALDLINRQEGVNEKNENIIRVADKTIATLQAENESLKTEVENLRMVLDAVEDHIHPLPFETDFDKAINKAKTEAYKEFVERLKEKLEHFCLEKENFVSEEQIDNLYKELVGDGDGKRKD
ncbi:MAG: hypothetical protein U0L88_04030 [Acutalibacteraceae bacterium]|nr:hypothetical protein [Acutalibacteraceae bacterium]